MPSLAPEPCSPRFTLFGPVIGVSAAAKASDFGDVKLAAVSGAWLDWPLLPIAIDLAALAALIAVLFARLSGKDLGWKAKLPFGAFFAPSIWLCWAMFAWSGAGFDVARPF